MTGRPRWSKSKQEKKKRDKEPKVIENPKRALVMYGRHSSEVVRAFVSDVVAMKKPQVVKFTENNPVLPFDDETPIETHCERRDCGLFLFASHQKKRPNNVVVGRTFDHHVLDMAEFGVERYLSASCFAGAPGVEPLAIGEKPCFAFSGPEFETDPDYVKVKSLFLDFFRGSQPESIALVGVRHVIHLAALPDRRVAMSVFTILLKKSGSKIPRVEVAETGPRAELQLRRTRWASDDLERESLRVPQSQRGAAKKKNVNTKAAEGTVGVVYPGRQELGKLSSTVRLPKALRKRPRAAAGVLFSEATDATPAEAANKRQRAD
eukprot:m51a1_g108 hypothetical protein (321) ;mRNA; f:328009-328971